MSYPLQVFLAQALSADLSLQKILGSRPDGNPAIYPYHHRDVADPAYPLITIARFGSKMNNSMFTDTMLATLMDAPKIAICSWSKNSVDEAIQIITLVRNMVRSPDFASGNQYFSGYKLTEKSYRDDLFDIAQSAYHVHCEYDGWIQERYGNPQPVPSS